MSQQLALTVRPGLLDQLKKTHRFETDAAMALEIGVTTADYYATKNGKKQPSANFVFGVTSRFNLGIGDVLVIQKREDQPEQVAA